MSQQDILRTAHPAFNVSFCRVMWFDKVSYISLNNNISEKDLVVSSPGIFVIKSRTFPRTFRVKLTIPYHEITAITVNRMNVFIIAKNASFGFSSSQQLIIVHRILQTRKLLFPNDIFPIDVTIEPSVADILNRFSYRYESTSILADRFFSLALKHGLPVQSAQIEGVCQLLAQIQSTFEITKKTLSLPHLEALFTAVAVDSSITELVIESVPTVNIFPTIVPFLQLNKNILRIVFKRCVFSGNFTSLSTYLSSDNVSIKEIILDSCDLKSNSFSHFMEAFIVGKAQISIFAVDMCSFSRESFDQFCQAIFNGAAFHSMSVLWISSQIPEQMAHGFLQQLLYSGSPAQALCIRNGKVQVNKIFSFVQKKLPPILDLSGNIFTSSPPNFEKYFCSEQKIILAKCEFQRGSLHGVFQSLSKFEGVLGVDLSMIENYEEIFEDEVVVPSLTELIFNNNVLKENNISKFVAFISRQPNLQRLSLNDCVHKDTFPSLLPYLEELFSKDFKEFHFASTEQKTCIGQVISPLVLSLINKGKIELLDISGQEIGPNNLSKIIKAIPPSLKSFSFDGNNIENETQFVEIIHSLFEFNLNTVSWPSKDIIRFQKDSIEESAFSIELDNLKHQFLQKFTPVAEQLTNLEIIYKYASAVNKYLSQQSLIVSLQSFRSDNDLQFWYYDPDELKILDECGAPDPGIVLRCIFKEICSQNN